MWKFGKRKTEELKALGEEPAATGVTTAPPEAGPLTTSEAIRACERAFALPTYPHYQDALVRGEGCYVYTPEGRRFLDLYGGHCVAGLGHCHPRLIEALTRQLTQFMFYSNLALNDTRARAYRALVEFAPAALTRAYFCNSGAEANETALKLAFAATCPTDGEQDGEMRRQVVAFSGAFHGRTAAAQLCNDRFTFQYPFPPFEVYHAPFGDLEALKHHLDGEVAAVIVEPIQSMAGCRMADRAFYAGVVRLAHAAGAVAIFDEVQTGLGRLGTPFAADFFEVEPDIITCAKSLGGGFPVAAVLTTEAIAETVTLGAQGTTFGGNPLAAAAVLAVLETIEAEQLMDNVKRVSAVLARATEIPGVADISGAGLLLGLKLMTKSRPVIAALYERDVLVGGSKDANVIRLMPPLVLSEAQAEGFLKTLAEAIAAATA